MSELTPAEMAVGFLGAHAGDAEYDLVNRWRDAKAREGEVPWQEYAGVLMRIDKLAASIREIRNEIEGIMAPLMPDRATAVEGVGLVEKHGSGKKTVWDAQGLSGAVSRVVGARLADDEHLYTDSDTGERVPPSETVRRAVGLTTEIVVACCGMSPSKSWSVGALSTLGIDPKEYKASEWSGWKVRVTPGIVDTTEGAGTDDE